MRKLGVHKQVHKQGTKVISELYHAVARYRTAKRGEISRFRGSRRLRLVGWLGAIEAFEVDTAPLLFLD